MSAAGERPPTTDHQSDGAGNDAVLIILCLAFIVPLTFAAATAFLTERRGWSTIRVSLLGIGMVAVVLMAGGVEWYGTGLAAVPAVVVGRTSILQPLAMAPLSFALGLATGPVLGWWWRGRLPDPNQHQRRRRREYVRRSAVATRIQPTDSAQGQVMLGPIVSGDLPGLSIRGPRQMKMLSFSVEHLTQHTLLAGGSGTGKTNTALTIAAAAMRSGWQVVLLDGKASRSTERQFMELAAGLGVAARSATDDPVDGWRGDPADLLNRLLTTQEFTEPYYASAATAILGAALAAPCPPPTKWTHLLPRLSKNWLSKAYAQHGGLPWLSRLRPEVLTGIELRYAGIARGMGGAVDGMWSFEDVQAAYVPLGTASQQHQAGEIAGWLIEDLSHWATERKSPGQKALVILDEFSRIAERAPGAVDLVERVRESGVGMMLVVQDWTGLGTDELTRSRLAGAARFTITHRLNTAEAIANLAGTDTGIELTAHIEGRWRSGVGSQRGVERYVIHPQQIRRLAAGEVAVIADGHAALVRVAKLHMPTRRP